MDQRSLTLTNTGVHVLVVGNQDGDAGRIVETLASTVRVERVDRVDAAIDHIEDSAVDVVVLDLSAVDAAELADLTRIRAAAPTVALVVLTDATDDRIGHRALLEGAQDFLRKDELDAASLERAIRQARARQRYAERMRQLTEERVGRTAAEAAHQRAQWLADAGKRLSSDRNEAAIIASFYSLAVPAFCRTAVLELAADPTRGHGFSHGDLQAARVAGTTVDRSRGPGSIAVSVPLAVDGRVFGAVRFGWSAPVEPEIVRLAEELALRVAMAIDMARLYVKAQDAVAVLEGFISVASHELRTPLATMRMAIELLMIELPDERVSRDHLLERLRKIDLHSTHLVDLISVLLDVSRMSSGQLTLTRTPCDAVEIARTTLDGLRTAAGRAHCDLTLGGDPRAEGTWDPLRIEQVLTNLLTNALKYGAGKPVHVVVQHHAGVVRVLVSDGGAGIRVADQERIFTRFQRVASTRTLPGLGLGLYVTRQIVEAHGGTVRVSASSPAGTTFLVELPLG